MCDSFNIKDITDKTDKTWIGYEDELAVICQC